MPLPKPEQKYSYADYLRWDDTERWEIIDGVPYMQASPSPKHQLILGELYRQFANYLQGKPCKVFPAPFTVRLGKENEKKDEDIKTVFEPDITIVCQKSKIDDKGCNGSPDMVIEIVSPSSVKRDKIIKFSEYERAGIKEYWLVEPDGKIVSIFVLQENNRYGRPEIYSDEDIIKVSIFKELEINLNLVFC